MRIANLCGVVADGPVEGWLRGPAEHWAEELVRLVSDLRFDGFVVSVDRDDMLGQTERFATDIVPIVRAALSSGGGPPAGRRPASRCPPRAP